MIPTRFTAQPGELTLVPADDLKATWEELPTLYRRAFQGYVDTHQAMAPGSVFKREDAIQVSLGVATIYYHDEHTGTRYRAQVGPGGSVECAPV